MPAYHHTLITGHSGAGKSTLAEELAEQTGKPIIHLDDDPSYREALQLSRRGLITPAQFTEASRSAVAKALRTKTPSIIEGTALLRATDLIEGHKKILVDPPMSDVLSARLAREKQKFRVAGRPWSQQEEHFRRALGKRIYTINKHLVDQFSRIPEVQIVRKRITVKEHTRLVGNQLVHVQSHERSVLQGPHSQIYRPIPKVKDQVWEFVIQDHQAKRAGRHFDMRLGDPSGDAHSWAIRRLPERGGMSFAAQTFTHDVPYMDFVGSLRGYGAGDVATHTRSKAYIHESSPDKIVFSVMQGKSTEDYALIHIRDKTWLIHNISVPEEKVPRGKESYKDVTFGMNLIDKYPDAVVAAKLDGAHTKILLRPGKRARAFSHRVSTIGDQLEYTHKIPGIFDLKASAGTGDTVLLAETVALNPRGKALPPTHTAGLLNATVLNSRETQRARGEVLTPFLFDIEQLNGISVKELPYIERQKLLRSIADKHPVFRLAPVAITRQEKEELIQSIAEKRHPLTTEGVVLFDKHPLKAKIKQEHDVYIREIYPGAGRLRGTHAGAFGYSWSPNGPVVGNVGTGLSDLVRQDMWKNPGRYIGRVARVTAMSKYPSGALEKPSFSEWHVEKNIGQP